MCFSTHCFLANNALTTSFPNKFRFHTLYTCNLKIFLQKYQNAPIIILLREYWENLPRGNQRCINSPTILPNPAPILNTGMKIPLGAGTVEEIIEVEN